MALFPNDFDLQQALDALETGLQDLGLRVARSGGADGYASLAFGDALQAQRAQADQNGTLPGPLETVGDAHARALGSFDDAAAYGLLVADIETSNQPNILRGTTKVAGTAKAEGRGVSFGLQEFLDPDETDPPVGEGNGGDDGDDDGEEDFGPGPEDFLPSFATHVTMGAGADVIEGRSNVSVNAGTGELIFAGSNGVIVDRDSVLETGGGNDTIMASGTLRAVGGAVGDNDEDGPSAGDADLEVIADGLENVGVIDMGNGADRIISSASAKSVSGATAIADGIDNSSVGNPNPVSGGVPEDGVRLLMGRGADTIDSRATANATGDAAIANGMDTRSLVDLGGGNDRVFLKASATFKDTGDLGEQEEAIADGLENRGTVLFGSGNDSLTAAATAKGNGVLMIADGIDSRGDPGINPDGDTGRGISIDAGIGNDTITATGTAIATAPLAGPENAGQKPAKTVASGFLLENGVAGTVLMGQGQDSVVAKGIAKGLATDTVAVGVSNVSFDIPNTEVRARLDLGRGADNLKATAQAEGTGKVAAFGIWGGETDAGGGNDTITATAHVKSAAVAQVIAVNIDDDFDLFGGTNSSDAEIVSDEGAVLSLGAGNDVLTARATAKPGVADGFVAGIFIGEGGLLDAGIGDDTIVASGKARGGVEAYAIAGEETGVLDTGAGVDVVDAMKGGFVGGFQLKLGTFGDTVRGFGEVDVDGEGGEDTAEFGFTLRKFLRDGGTVETGGETDVAMTLNGQTMTFDNVELFVFKNRAIAVEDLQESVDLLMA